MIKLAADWEDLGEETTLGSIRPEIPESSWTEETDEIDEIEEIEDGGVEGYRIRDKRDKAEAKSHIKCSPL